MKQSSFRYLGVFDLLLVAVFVAVFGVRALASSVVLPAMALAGVSAILAGSVAEVAVGPVAVTWRYFAALTYALFAVMLPGGYLPAVLAGTASGQELALFAVTSIGGSRCCSSPTTCSEAASTSRSNRTWRRSSIGDEAVPQSVLSSRAATIS